MPADRRSGQAKPLPEVFSNQERLKTFCPMTVWYLLISTKDTTLSEKKARAIGDEVGRHVGRKVALPE